MTVVVGFACVDAMPERPTSEGGELGVYGRRAWRVASVSVLLPKAIILKVFNTMFLNAHSDVSSHLY
jgi:hypothetical protein